MGKEIKMNQPQEAQMQINPNDLEDVVCEKCESQCFEPTFLFKRLSAVLSPNGKDTMIPLQIYRCADCGHINEVFLPKSAQPLNE
tara:strand:+ start:352 stop:606 length:255 start_codon:yes stop_codon:yes gene_type:complete